MTGRIVGIIVLIFSLPFLWHLALWGLGMVLNPGDPSNINETGSVMADAVIPWWITPLEFFLWLGVPLLTVAFLFWLFGSGAYAAG